MNKNRYRKILRVFKKGKENSMMKKYGKILLCVATFVIQGGMTSFAGQWKLGTNGWWYDNGNGTYLVNGWHWLDENKDNIAECYYFNEAGWLLTQTVTPDGYQVNENGAWVINGEIQVRSINTSIRNAEIPDDAIEYNGHYYYFYSNICDTWEKAEEYCRLKGGYLSIIDDDEENNALYDAMKDLGYESAYFGLSDTEKEGKWKCVDGTIAEYTNWDEDEPNNERGIEDYAMFFYGVKAYKWNDGDFGHGTPGGRVFICEWDG